MPADEAVESGRPRCASPNSAESGAASVRSSGGSRAIVRADVALDGAAQVFTSPGAV